MSNLQALYKQRNASGGQEITLYCLSFRCAAWSESVHLCNGFVNRVCTLEDNSVVTFVAADFAVTIKNLSRDGTHTIKIGLDPKQSDALRKIDEAFANQEVIYIDYREYLISDLSEPARKLLGKQAINYSYQQNIDQNGRQTETLFAEASFYDLVNKAYPPQNQKYNGTDFKGLKYAE